MGGRIKILGLVSACFIALFLPSCNSDAPDSRNTTIKYLYINNHLVREIYDSIGKIKIRKTLNEDTTSYGSELNYYDNGKIEKWKWFFYSEKYPDCVIYYNDNGAFDTLQGNPFISTIYNKERILCVKLINPPNVKIKVGYRNYYRNKIVQQFAYSPIETDSVAWVFLYEHKPKKNHNYKLYYYVVDSLNHIQFELSTELQNHEDD